MEMLKLGSTLEQIKVVGGSLIYFFIAEGIITHYGAYLNGSSPSGMWNLFPSYYKELSLATLCNIKGKKCYCVASMKHAFLILRAG